MDTAERELWPRLGNIAEEALTVEPGRRSEFLDRLCGVDTDLRHRIDALLEADHDAGSFLEIPAAAELTTEILGPLAETLSTGHRIGPYRIVSPLGSGGIGEVFLAERADDGFEQQVAIKVLRRRLGTDDAERRILTERQILARLSHPNIARLYDGGTTEDGRPYLVMEYVDGLPIDLFCARHRLTVEARIQLFLKLCSAVQFAHQNFVVHRDLKPSNILVTPDGNPKLLDFSIAKAIAPEPDLAHRDTATGVVPMTLAYASPEQIRGEPVTTATDVHGLGIVLYRILTGRHPFLIEGRPVKVALEAVCFDEPTAPSRVVADLHLATPAETAGETPRPPADEQLSKRLAGDLDAIVLKALEKKPADRYGSAEQLAADLRRHLRRLPIEARPPSLGYRFRKAVSRHRTFFLLIAVTTVLAVAFVAALLMQIERANAEAERANREARSAEEVADFLVGVFQVFTPNAGTGGAVTARELLDRSFERVRADLGTQPESQGDILQAIGASYQQLGLFDSAGEAFREALGVRSEHHGERSLEVAETLNRQAQLAWTTGDHTGARKLFERSLEMARAHGKEGDSAVSESLQGLGVVAWIEGRLEEAETYGREALRIRRALLGDLHLETAAAANDLAIALEDQGKLEEAEPLFLEAIATREQLKGPQHPDLGRCLTNLAALYAAQDRDGEAEALLVRAVGIWKQAFGDDHPLLGGAWINLGILYVESGRLEKAEEAVGEARRILTAFHGPDHPWALMADLRQAHVWLEQDRLEEAEALMTSTNGRLETALGPAHPILAEGLEIQGRILEALGRQEESKRWLERSYETLLSVYDLDNPRVLKFCDRRPAICRDATAASGP